MSRLIVVVRRVVHTIPVLVGVAFLVFLLIQLVPGDPATTLLGQRATPERVAALRDKWNLNDSLLVQFGTYLASLIRGDLGDSFLYQDSVGDVILARLWPTLGLLFYATVLTVVISIPLSIIAVSKRDGVRDHAVRTLTVVGLGMPPFWVGIMLVLLFALQLRWFPVGGVGSGLLDQVRSLFLPALTIAVAMSPLVIRSLRASMLEVLESDYVTTARALGLPERRVFSRHVLRNSLVPAVTVLGVNLGFFIGGTVVIESVFAIPGLGQLMVQSIYNRDFPVVQGVTLVLAVLVILVNLLTDLSYSLLDPRVKFS
jgi:peptide/nickel transport system permease protein